VERLEAVVWDPRIFESLVINDEDKNMIKTLVLTEASATSRDKGVDFVSGKGNGLVMLLHGYATMLGAMTTLTHTQSAWNWQDVDC
jgi:hypothetical protein